MIRTLAASALLLLTASPCLPQDPGARSIPAAAYPVLDDLRWHYEPGGSEKHPRHQLRITREGHAVTLDQDEARAIMGDGAAASLNSPGEAVSFALARPAGALACTGKVERAGRASGTCRFDPDEGFIAALAQRGLRAEDSGELMSLTLVDARVESVDELSRAGFAIDDVDDMIAITALEVTAAFAGELRAAGLTISETQDLIAAKAVKVDPEWLKAMAEAGYPNLDIEDAIQMRALDVTPEYARKMARVNAALDESQAR